MHAYVDAHSTGEVRGADAAGARRTGGAIAIGAVARPCLEPGMFLRLGGVLGIAMIAVNGLLSLAR